MKIRKALIPCAGLGTRLLPSTKVVPKELFPVLNRPALEYIVDELVNSGIEEVIFILHPSKQSVLNHFLPGGYVEDSLKFKGTLEKYPVVTKYRSKPKFRVAYQYEAKGLGDAVLAGKQEIGEDTFVVVLPDDLIRSKVPVVLQLIEKSQKTGKNCVAIQEVEKSETGSYGIISGDWSKGSEAYLVRDLVEKPNPNDAPSQMAVIGRYVLPASIFRILENLQPSAGGEIQLTDALKVLAQKNELLALPFEGHRIDMGQPHGFVEANLVYAFDDELCKKHLTKVIAQLGKVR